MHGSSVGRALMPRKQRVVGLNPTQGNSFMFEKRLLWVVELFAFALRITPLMTHGTVKTIRGAEVCKSVGIVEGVC